MILQLVNFWWPTTVLSSSRLLSSLQNFLNHHRGGSGLVAKSCPTHCDPMDYCLPGSSVHGDSPGKNTGVGCHFLLQGIFPTRESNPDLLNCRQILYQLSYERHLLAVPGPNALLMLQIVFAPLQPILNLNKKFTWICFFITSFP